MDEPTSSLDAMTKEQIQQLILRYQKKLGMTLLFVTHDIGEAVFLGEKIVLLEDGGTAIEVDNPYFSKEHARKQTGFYEKCIEIRTLLERNGYEMD